MPRRLTKHTLTAITHVIVMRTPHQKGASSNSPAKGISSENSGATSLLIQHSIRLELLTPAQERALASQRIEADREIALLEKTLVENKPRKGSRTYLRIQQCLDNAIKSKDDAVCAFMERNIRLAIKVAGDMGFLPTPMESRISSALEGIRDAALRFDPDKGGKFSTYAGFWIRQRIFRDNQIESRTIRLSANMMQRLSKVVRAEPELHTVYGRAATDTELGEHLGLNEKQMRAIRLAQQTMAISIEPQSEEIDSLALEDQLADPKAIIPGTLDLSADRLKILQQALKSLDERERAIISARFGLNETGETDTLETVGRRFGVTRERIRQLENIALGKLRKSFEDSDTPNLVLLEARQKRS